MRADDQVLLCLTSGRATLANLSVFRIPSMYNPKDPDDDRLGLYVETPEASRCVKVNTHHREFKGTYDAIVRLLHEFASGKLNDELVDFVVNA